MKTKQRFIAVLVALFAVATPVSAQYIINSPSWQDSFRHGFFDQLGRTGVPLLLGGIRHLTMQYQGPFPTSYIAPTGCQPGYVCFPETYVRQQLVYLGRIYVPAGQQPGVGNVSPPPAPPATPPAPKLSAAEIAAAAYSTLGPAPDGRKVLNHSVQAQAGHTCDDGSPGVLVESGNSPGFKHYRYDCPNEQRKN